MVGNGRQHRLRRSYHSPRGRARAQVEHVFERLRLRTTQDLPCHVANGLKTVSKQRDIPTHA